MRGMAWFSFLKAVSMSVHAKMGFLSFTTVFPSPLSIYMGNYFPKFQVSIREDQVLKSLYTELKVILRPEL